MMLTKIKSLFDRLEGKKLASEFYEELRERKRVNITVTLTILANYLVQDQLERTGILYSPVDRYIQTKAQHLFWEWKNEGIINEFDDFVETTKEWIKQYS